MEKIGSVRMWAKKLWGKDLGAGSTLCMYLYYSRKKKKKERHMGREKGLTERKEHFC